jgi:hypothetical protein
LPALLPLETDRRNLEAARIPAGRPATASRGILFC